MIRATLLILAILPVAAAPLLAGDRPTHPGELEFDPLEVKIPEADRTELGNGMVLYFIESHELPLVDLTIWFRSGSKYEPAEKAGLASFTAAYVRNGGTGSMNRQQLDERLEFLAAQLGVSIADEHGEVNLSVMRKDLDEGLAVTAELLREPAFDPDMFMLIRQNFANGIQRRGDAPAGILGEVFPRLLYGDHPYGRVPTLATLSAITREDCVAFWKKYLQPDRMILGVSGDVKKDEIVAKLEKVFGDWKSEEVEEPEVPALERSYSHGVYLAPHPGTQSHIRLAHRGVKRTDPDRVTLDVMNLILGGGGFSSRLTQIVRAREGLAYDVNSWFTRQMDLGLFQASVQTKAETTWKAIGLILAEMKRMRDEPVTEDDLAFAKDMILNGRVFGFADPVNVVGNYVSLEYYGYPRDWMTRWQRQIEGITIEDIQRVAKEYLRPDGVTIVIVGDPEKFDAAPEGMPEAKIVERR